jgi:hypothetical protein
MVESLRGGRRWSAAQEIVWAAIPGVLQQQVTDALDRNVNPERFAQLVGGALESNAHRWNRASAAEDAASSASNGTVLGDDQQQANGASAAEDAASSASNGTVLGYDQQQALVATVQALLVATPDGLTQALGLGAKTLISSIDEQYALVFDVGGNVRWDAVVPLLRSLRPSPSSADSASGRPSPSSADSASGRRPWDEVAKRVFGGDEDRASYPELWVRSEVKAFENYLAATDASRLSLRYLANALLGTQTLLQTFYRKFAIFDKALSRNLTMVLITVWVEEIFLKPQDG